MRRLVLALVVFLTCVVFVAPVFAQSRILYVDGDEIWIMRDDGSSAAQFTNPGSGEYDTSPSVCPTGRKVFFTRWTGSGADIWSIDPDGTDETKIIVDDPEDELSFFLDPDCGKGPAATLDQFIIFSATRDGYLDVFRMDLDGENVVNLTNTDTQNESYASWCGISHRAIFSRLDDNSSPDPDDWDLWIMEIDEGDNKERLTDNDIDGLHGAINDYYGSCSPDGNWALWTGGANTYRTVWKLDLTDEEAEPVDLTDGHWGTYQDDLSPAFSPGGDPSRVLWKRRMA